MEHTAPVNPWVALAYLVAGVCFILALRGLSSPATAQRGNRLGMIGMALAVGTTLFVGCAIGKVSVDEVMKGIWPFYWVMFAVLMLVTYIPWFSMALPHAFGFR